MGLKHHRALAMPVPSEVGIEASPNVRVATNSFIEFLYWLISLFVQETIDHHKGECVVVR